ncbi:hypothetical protein [Lysinibacillus pakistanensis]|uniref:Chromatin assembly factor 1 p150 subunit acidic region domain-containing protein n=1 Tax=Lysinibacillus pakistanensis TaxID=759811 RepID=A0ABX6DA12_9BACI|nr:hypothetical protein GDS87_12015 [Lysinibacillus pakistanensis]
MKKLLYIGTMSILLLTACGIEKAEIIDKAQEELDKVKEREAEKAKKEAEKEAKQKAKEEKKKAKEEEKKEKQEAKEVEKEAKQRAKEEEKKAKEEEKKAKLEAKEAEKEEKKKTKEEAKLKEEHTGKEKEVQEKPQVIESKPKENKSKTAIDTSVFEYANSVQITDAIDLNNHVTLIINMKEATKPGLAMQHVVNQTYDFIQQVDVKGAKTIGINIKQGANKIAQFTVFKDKFVPNDDEPMSDAVIAASDIEFMTDEVKVFGKTTDSW